jgi:hypothetical protein
MRAIGAALGLIAVVALVAGAWSADNRRLLWQPRP